MSTSIIHQCSSSETCRGVPTWDPSPRPRVSPSTSARCLAPACTAARLPVSHVCPWWTEGAERTGARPRLASVMLVGLVGVGGSLVGSKGTEMRAWGMPAKWRREGSGGLGSLCKEAEGLAFRLHARVWACPPGCQGRVAKSPRLSCRYTAGVGAAQGHGSALRACVCVHV